jgi:hypothetical protein
MVTAAHSNNGRNQSTCIEKGKPKNNNKIRQHEKNKPIFQFPLFFFSCPTPFLLKQSPLQLSSPSIAMTASNACDQPSPPSQQPAAEAAAATILPIPQTSGVGCVQIISSSLCSSTTSTLN